MKVATVVGTRPEFVQSALTSRELRKRHSEILVHIGQHYDDAMSAAFFRELGIPEPDYNLGVGSGLHGQQTGRMLERIETVLLAERPDWVLVYGDTNSTLAGALAAVKLHIPVAHVEAGMRSFNRVMPEEHNRVLADHCADLLFCPTQTAVDNLAREGITRSVHLVDDVTCEAVSHFGPLAQDTILEELGLESGNYLLTTVHRPQNTDDPDNLSAILAAFSEMGEPVVFPVHPRTRQRMAEAGLSASVQFIEPMGYLDMLALERNARLILTDSGGVQKEAYFLGVPCVTLRDETEWVETVEAGWNVLVGANRGRIVEVVKSHVWPQGRLLLFEDGQVSRAIVKLLESHAREIE